MSFKMPTAEQLREIGEELGMEMSDAYVEAVRGYIPPFVDAYNLIARIPDHLPPVKYPRTPGYRPEGDENRYGAWYVKTAIKGARRGKLKGKRVAVKDTMCVAGVPMMNGASVLEGYVPDVDATVVTRLLDAGAEIVGKSVCEYFSFSGGSATSATGPVDNPRNPGYTPGGSSTGSAALVQAGEVDMALGGDQAGSIRIPASYSGVVGMKPTFGLVPYSGIMSLEATIDHAGPLTGTVADNALCLEVLAGEDGMDSRQRNVRTARYSNALDKGAKGLRVAVVKEGFGQPDSEPDVDAAVRAAAGQLRKLGAEVVEVSIPWHHFGVPIWGPITLEGNLHNMVWGGGVGHNTAGLYVTSLIKAMSGLHDRADELPDTVKVGLLLGHYSDRHYHGHFYAKAQNLRRRLAASYDAVLADHDVLLMPTTRMKTSRIPGPGAPLDAVMKHSWENIANTCPFDVTGHPSISIPCGIGDRRPIGLMLTAGHWQESTLYRAAHAFEQSVDWQKIGTARKRAKAAGKAGGKKAPARRRVASPRGGRR